MAGEDPVPGVRAPLAPGLPRFLRGWRAPQCARAVFVGDEPFPNGMSCSPTRAGRQRSQQLHPAGEEPIPDARKPPARGMSRSRAGMACSRQKQAAGTAGGSLPDRDGASRQQQPRPGAGASALRKIRFPAMEMLERLKHQAAAWPELKLAVLFGSTARGQARPKSDVDLGILLDPYSPELRFRVEAELGRAAGRPVDVILLDDAPPLLRFEIAREGVLLFQREDHLWTDFKARAMVDWWDWAPTHRMIAAGVVRRLRERIASGQG
jgi:uncharacterized protein